MSRALATWLPQALGSPFCVLWLCSSLCKLGQKAPLGSRLLRKSTHWGEVATDGAVAEGTLCHPCRRALARCPSCQHGHRCRTCAAARSPLAAGSNLSDLLHLPCLLLCPESPRASTVGYQTCSCPGAEGLNHPLVAMVSCPIFQNLLVQGFAQAPGGSSLGRACWRGCDSLVFSFSGAPCPVGKQGDRGHWRLSEGGQAGCSLVDIY